jgi:hypothetical protein
VILSGFTILQILVRISGRLCQAGNLPRCPFWAPAAGVADALKIYSFKTAAFLAAVLFCGKAHMKERAALFTNTHFLKPRRQTKF